MFEAAGLLAPPSPAQVGLNCHKPLFVEKNSNVTVTTNSDVNLFYLIYIYIYFSVLPRVQPSSVALHHPVRCCLLSYLSVQ